MWKSFENIGLQTSEKVSWEKIKKKHAQNIRSTVYRTGDLIMTIGSHGPLSFTVVELNDRQYAVLTQWSVD